MDDICDHSNCAHSVNKSVYQTLSEMDWERGIWYAGKVSFYNFHAIIVFNMA